MSDGTARLYSGSAYDPIDREGRHIYAVSNVIKAGEPAAAAQQPLILQPPQRRADARCPFRFAVLPAGRYRPGHPCQITLMPHPGLLPP